MGASDFTVTDADLDLLDAYLLSDQSPPDCMLLSDLDGFLTGVAIGPEVVMPSEWLPHVWDGQEPVFDDPVQASANLGTILGRYIRQFLHHNPVGISYLFGCGGQASGAVVDPVGDIGPYLRASEETRMGIKFVVDPPTPANPLSAAPPLAAATGAAYVLSSRADVAFPFHAVE